MVYNCLRDAAPPRSRKERISIINTILFQKYHVLSLLGSGGSSSVYLAEHLKLNQYRAIKCIPKALTRNASGYLEAGLLKNLRHPGIPMIFDTEEDENYFYIIEEYIQGESLSAFVQNQDNISQETVISFGIQLCEIMEYLHNQRPNPILYLDLKPEHIILCGNQLKLIDFGIATTLHDSGNLFQSCGTRGFAAPEQYTGKGLKEQTDVFGIGAMLYYMLTKEVLPSFFKTSFTFPKYCSRDFKKIILKAVSPGLEQRYRQVAQLRRELEKVSLCLTGQVAGMHLLDKIIITGSQERVGATHISIGLVSWLNRQGTESFYEAKGERNPLSSLLSYKEGVTQENGICRYQDFQAVCTPTYASWAIKPHMLVQDYGANIAATAEEESAAMVILVAGGRPWEIEQGIRAYERLSDEDNLIIICNYNDKQTARKYAEIFRKKVFCFPLDKDPFIISEEKHHLFQQIFKERRENIFG